MALRKLTPQEEQLLEILVQKASLGLRSDWKNQLLAEMKDDNLNRLLTLFPKGIKEEGRTFGRNVSEYTFKDQDGVIVSAALYLDSNGNLFGLDMWKTDDSPLISLSGVLSRK